MKVFIKKYSSLILSLLFLWIFIVSILLLSLKLNSSHLVYTVDDAYIHMAIAKNFALYGVWGVTRYSFSSSSSSLLYTLMLSLFYLIF